MMEAGKYSVSENNIHLDSSYQVRQEDFESELKAIRERFPDSLVWKRSMESLKREWATHNALYCLGYERERTKDVDLDIPSDHPEWMYKVIGTIVWPFIK